MKTKLPLIRTMQIGFGVLVAILLIVCSVAYRGVLGSTMSARWAQHTNEVLEHIASLRSTTESIESGYRDFALSGDDAFLQLSADSRSVANREQRTLRALTVDNPRQQRRLGSVAGSIQRIIQDGETWVRLRRTEGPGAAADAFRNAHGDSILDEFRAVARDMEDEERRLLIERNVEMERRYGRTKTAVIVGSALALLIALVAGWMVPRDYAERLEAQDNLRRLNRLDGMVSG
ncbi:MAG: sensor signal transduction histidine kinase, partial [Gammaproteobacteria bacterium]|nr:sensor signal transduction histidine kinase [Gammaproteobacteria bacterium]